MRARASVLILSASLALAAHHIGCSESSPPPSTSADGGIDGSDSGSGPPREGGAPTDGGGQPRDVWGTDTGSSSDGRAFFAPSEPAGSLVVRLYPHESLPPSSEETVTFGLPFPRGSITVSDLTRIRVLDASGAELPAYVDELLPWRHARDKGVDGASVRIARIQFRKPIRAGSSGFDTVTVSWGGATRGVNQQALADVRASFVPVVSGTFRTEDGVAEPRVYATLPKEWLTRGAIRPTRMVPFADEVPDTRDDPSAMKGRSFSSLTKLDYAHKNFFYTSINEDDPRVAGSSLCPYRTDSEPWLYDRAATFFGLYLRSGSYKALREAVRAAEFYRAQLYPEGTTPSSAVGAFRLKSPNASGYIGANGTMYSYSEPLAFAHALLADPEMLAPIAWVSKAHEDATDEPYRYGKNAGYTERHIGFRLLSHAYAYQVLGDRPYKPGGATYRELIETGADNLIFHQDGAGGAVPSGGVDGALWKTGAQQGDGPEASYVASAWLSPVVVDAMVHVYSMTERADVATFVRRMGTFLGAASKSTKDNEYGHPTPLRQVDYVTLHDGGTYEPDGTFGEHALEVAAALGWAHYFAEREGRSDPALGVAAKELYDTFGVSVDYWTRPSAPPTNTAFRIAPWRKFNWQFRVSQSLSFCLSEP